MNLSRHMATLAVAAVGLSSVGGGGGKSTKCTSVIIDPATGTAIGTCTTNRV